MPRILRVNDPNGEPIGTADSHDGIKRAIEGLGVTALTHLAVLTQKVDKVWVRWPLQRFDRYEHLAHVTGYRLREGTPRTRPLAGFRTASRIGPLDRHRPLSREQALL